MQKYVFLFLISLSLFPQISNAIERYGTFGLYPQGGTRVTAMGGAYGGVSDDVQGIHYNPAGLVMGDWWGDVGGNANIVYNKEADLNNDGIRDGIPYTYVYYAAALRSGNSVFGLGVSSPYYQDLSFDTQNGAYKDNRRIVLGITSVDIPYAYRISPSFSIGVTIHNYELNEKYQFKSENPSTPSVLLTAHTKATSATMGVAYRSNSTWGLGFSHRPEVKFDIDESLNSQTSGINWFRGAKIPSRTILGSFYRPSASWLFVMDFDLFGPSTDSIYVGSELISGFNRVVVEPKAKLLIHGGTEWHLVDTKMFEFLLRAGAFYEPPRIIGNKGRAHTTAGLEVRYWLLVFSLAVDTASDFFNAAGGFGLSLKAVF